MPFRRSKACVNCRRAKARCSLAKPCSRCADRRLECHYIIAYPPRPVNRWPEGFRPIKPADTLPRAQGPLITSDAAGAELFAPSQTGDMLTSPHCNVLLEQTKRTASTVAGPCNQIPDLPVCSGEVTQYSDVSFLFDTSLPADWTLQSPGLSFDDLLSSPRLGNSDINTPTMIPNTQDRTANAVDLTTLTSMQSTTTGIKALGPQLSQRTRSLQQGSLTARMIFSRLAEYSRMMADPTTLPPFIHPPCCLSYDCDDCRPDSPHQCLPEALAVCANLTHMFYSRLPGSQVFVWKQIYAHLQQMRKEVRASH
ncbi:hypothetical protein N7462_010132 [Penicillium macrosclerotiorum]|uniref:uncharacterized protein n=1 Tax=Penicillium macrosclerotiorum TaxID=303699 RepID=UPI002547A16F|nr:uncharacterized protein N7462_010132 [Penicillium macrosclerotiorum]KAJ5669062.1 hypothetical protein N7462_010132 [Penicillium macrosclerotiorum]